MSGFFSDNIEIPASVLEQNLGNKQLSQQVSRRKFLKSAAGASALVTLPNVVLATNTVDQFVVKKSQDPWLTLNAVQNHMLPSSASGPGANEINALLYLFQVVTVQPTDADEKTFITKGVEWLNGFSQTKHSRQFIQLTQTEKEAVLRAISKSNAGENWLSSILRYILEAMLSPPAYGGNPNGIGWRWLAHQPGFPLPEKGGRYYEIPSRFTIPVVQIDQSKATAYVPKKAIEDTRKS